MNPFVIIIQQLDADIIEQSLLVDPDDLGALRNLFLEKIRRLFANCGWKHSFLVVTRRNDQIISFTPASSH
jgi:hypothetical protein